MAVDTAPPQAPPRTRQRRGRWLRRIGKLLIALGALVLLFVAYELWGTRFVTERYQAELRHDVERRGGLPARPVPGGAVAVLRIPKIELDMVVVEGTDVEALKKGPGHYSDTPLPGYRGNTGIAGHRTTYKAPFWALNELRKGDRILVETRRGRFTYEVSWQRVVAPTDVWVLDRTKRASVTLTTCHPRFSAAQRLIVRGVLVDGPYGPVPA